MNIFSVISAGALSLLQTIRSGALLQLLLLLFMRLFSLIGRLYPCRHEREMASNECSKSTLASE